MDIGKLTSSETRALTDLIKRAAGKGDFAKTMNEMLGDPDRVVFRISTKDRPNLELKLKDLNEDAIRDLGKLRDSSEKLEGALVKQMLEAMQRTLPKNPLDGQMTQFAKDMMNQSLADDMGAKGTLGLGSILFRDMSNTILRDALAHKISTVQEKNK